MTEQKRKILFAIPARKNSKRIKNKNLMPFRGKPLVLHSIETALASKLADRIIVTTDSEEIGGLAQKSGVQYIKRPAEFAGDLSPDIEWLRHALEVLQSENYTPDYIVHLRPTSPIRDAKLIDHLILKLIETPEADALRTVEQIKYIVEKCVYIGDDGFMKDYFGNNLRDINLCAQNFRPSLTANGYLDIFKNMDFTNEPDIYHNLRVIAHVMPAGSVLDIDQYEDLNNFKTI